MNRDPRGLSRTLASQDVHRDAPCLLVMANIYLLYKHVRECAKCFLSIVSLSPHTHPGSWDSSLSLLHKLECKAELESQLVRAGAERDPRLSVDRTGLTILLSPPPIPSCLQSPATTLVRVLVTSCQGAFRARDTLRRCTAKI